MQWAKLKKMCLVQKTAAFLKITALKSRKSGTKIPSVPLHSTFDYLPY